MGEEGAGVKPGEFLPHLPPQFRDAGPDKLRDVFDSLPQRHYRGREVVETAVEDLAEPALAHLICYVPVARGNN